MIEQKEEDYTCPNHQGTSGYEPCCPCGGWGDGEPPRKCSQNDEQDEQGEQKAITE